MKQLFVVTNAVRISEKQGPTNLEGKPRADEVIRTIQQRVRDFSNADGKLPRAIDQNTANISDDER